MAGIDGRITSRFTSRRPRTGNANVLECGVCGDVFFLQGDKVPRLLLCGHTFCHDCLTRLPTHGRLLHCPMDRQVTELGDSGIWGLKKNFALLELLEKLQEETITLNNDGTADNEVIPCDENEDHTASVYCLVCNTHLCAECSESSHSTRTLMKHKRVPLSQKPRQRPTCPEHQTQLLEFSCLEKDCERNPLMCVFCKDYGRHKGHKHTLVETDADNVRLAIVEATQHIKVFTEEVTEAAKRLTSVIQQIEGGMQMSEDRDSLTEFRQVPGTAELARTRVRVYFNELHESLYRQEEVAISVVDSHAREKLRILRQQQEDLAIVLSQTSAICLQWERVLQQDNSRVVMAKQEVSGLVDTLGQHQQQLKELCTHIPSDGNIPITFTKDNRVHIGPKLEMRVVILGLDSAGKTTILFKLKQNEFIQSIPTIGFNVETVEYKNLMFTIWDVGGDTKLRPLWKHYYLNTQAIIFVIDSSNCDRLSEAYEELSKLLTEKELRDALVLVFASKQDIAGSLSTEELAQRLELHKLCCGRVWHIQGCDARSGNGLLDGLDWLSRQLVAAGVLDVA
ncbi:E3 ubiquitin-protein ligase TRIM23-like [Ptychodera flava]|uniref:E3 ubiquitin-protein ligase TRIM23-like n=1 Tax=Ptychodera flava TaxID=63121 RepID=UPI00396A20F2